MHTRKKDGQRKDKKMARMREDVEERHEGAQEKRTTDQHDVTPYKTGSARDRSVSPEERHYRKG
jgi:hypothetical protein